ncbi:hypothetical protein F4815DRAFT_490608 [Daldinia loculata]|nr:hypothetical protein F4815DRAFT_490608 [Daldinia loculata]
MTAHNRRTPLFLFSTWLLCYLFTRRAFDPSAPSSDFTSQFTNPTDIFSVLLLLGGDVLVGSRITPVAFSFGWVAYAVTAVLSAIGGDRLMPAPDYSCKVVNAQNGFVRDNDSWIIGRIVRDFETWMDKVNRVAVRNPVENSVKEMIDLSWENMKRCARERGKPEPARPPKAGLCVPVYRARKPFKNYPGYDSPYIAGLVTCLLQLGVAAIPCGLYGNWSILLVTGAGMILAFISGAIPQWAKEKWACREDTEKTFALTRGDVSQYSIVIQGTGVGFDLEDLAASDWGTIKSWPARLVVLVLAVLWIFLLIAASGIQQNTWFLLAVGGLGILQNTYVAGASRSPEAFGMPLEFVEVIAKSKVMNALLAAEDRYPRVGRSLLPIFFAEELDEGETARWKDYENRNKIDRLKHNN